MKQFGCIAALAMGMAAGAWGQVSAPAPSSQLLDPLSISASGLPDSPGAVKEKTVPPPQQDSSEPWWMRDPNPQSPAALGLSAPCPNGSQPPAQKQFDGTLKTGPCPPPRAIYKPFVDADKHVAPLTPRQKARLAVHDVRDPFNLLTIAGTSAYFVGTTPHNPYGPGVRGFAYSASVSLSQDVTGEAIGTFAVCSLFHQDPRYFRMPHATPLRRLVHAVSHVVIAQGDNGRPMLNYSNFITSAASAEISNAYVPGLATDPASTTERIFGGFLTEPIGTIVAEFLPDVASHIHINVVIVQRYLNQISAQNGTPASPGVP